MSPKKTTRKGPDLTRPANLERALRGLNRARMRRLLKQAGAADLEALLIHPNLEALLAQLQQPQEGPGDGGQEEALEQMLELPDLEALLEDIEHSRGGEDG